MPATAAGRSVTHHAPHRVAVVGAGMVGLATAWFLQERGVEVTVIDREGVAAGSSWGNAGWLTPGIATPLPEPAVLKYGLRAVLSPNSPGLRAAERQPRLPQVRHRLHPAQHDDGLEEGDGRARARQRPVARELRPAARPAASAPRPSRRSRSSPPTAPPTSAGPCSRRSSTSTPPVRTSSSTCSPATRREPSSRRCRTRSARRSVLHGQRFINPGAYVARPRRLGHRPRRQDRHRPQLGGPRHRRRRPRRPRRDRPVASRSSTPPSWPPVRGSASWRASSACESRRPGRSRLQLLASPVDHVPERPRLLPGPARRLHAARRPPARRRDDGVPLSPRPRLDQRRIQAIVEPPPVRCSRAPTSTHRQDEWVGSRPCTVDGLPLIGATRSPRVFAAGGHGMWGITLGPVTGRLLAEQMVSGRTPAELAPFSPTR